MQIDSWKKYLSQPTQRSAAVWSPFKETSESLRSKDYAEEKQ